MRTALAATVFALSVLGAGTCALGGYLPECSGFKDMAGRITRPDLPACMTYIGPQSGDSEKQECLDQLNQNQTDLQQYKRCLQAELTDAIREHNDAIRQFDCLAGALCR